MRSSCTGYGKADAGTVVADAVTRGMFAAVTATAIVTVAVTLRSDKFARTVKIAVKIAVCERPR